MGEAREAPCYASPPSLAQSERKGEWSAGVQDRQLVR